MLDEFLTRLRDWLWSERGSLLAPGFARRTGRYVWAVARDLADGQINMRAMSLVYTTLLSVVPLLALSFSLLKAFGVHNMLQPVLLRVLAPLGTQAGELADQIVGFVDKIKVGVLGSLGLALLFWSALSLIQKVEGSFNYIWHVKRPRPLGQRVGEYMAVLLVGPVLVFSAIGLTASVFSGSIAATLAGIEPFGFLLYLGSKALPYLLIIGAFAFAYIYIPNRGVSLRAAAIGGTVAGFAWQAASVAFASFVSRSTNYNAVYSGFAIVIFLLIWIYVGWLILLVGCLLTYYLEHPEKLRVQDESVAAAGRQREQLALLAMVLCGRRFMRGEPGYTAEQLTQALGCAPEPAGDVIDALLHQGLLAETAGEPVRLLPARDPSALPMAQVWLAARGARAALQRADADARALAELIERAEQDFARDAGAVALREWIERMHES
ncbi:MAG TPA: YihY/virulence factor BrkB family protein [Nevskiaceae bacterium]|nr:YihY/virulence factor BrkB family protein [Nevskiaceae bacterium]